MNEHTITTDGNSPTQDEANTASNNEKQYRRMPYIPFLTDKISKHLAKDYPDVVIEAKNIKNHQRTIH